MVWKPSVIEKQAGFSGDSMVKEIAVEFKNQGQVLRGLLHIPQGVSDDFAKRHPCVVFLHDYASDRIGEHRILVKTARHLCSNGLACLRFDFRGSGESEGDFSDMTLETEISDAKAAIDFVRSLDAVDPERIGLLGQSFGASVAICIAAEAQVASLVLWAPTIFADYLVERDGKVLIDPYVWLPPKYKEELKRTGKVDIGGLTRGRGFFESLTRVHPLESLSKFQGPVLIICGSEDEVVAPINSDIVYDNVPGQRRLVVIADADHCFSSGIWEAEVIQETCTWLKMTLA